MRGLDEIERMDPRHNYGLRTLTLYEETADLCGIPRIAKRCSAIRPILARRESNRAVAYAKGSRLPKKTYTEAVTVFKEGPCKRWHYLSALSEGRLRDAFEMAENVWRREEIAASHALFDFDAARSRMRAGEKDYLGVLPLKVIMIEACQRGLESLAEGTHSKLEAMGMNYWDRMHLVWGIGGLEPWVGYPLLDY